MTSGALKRARPARADFGERLGELGRLHHDAVAIRRRSPFTNEAVGRIGCPFQTQVSQERLARQATRARCERKNDNALSGRRRLVSNDQRLAGYTEVAKSLVPAGVTGEDSCVRQAIGSHRRLTRREADAGDCMKHEWGTRRNLKRVGHDPEVMCLEWHHDEQGRGGGRHEPSDSSTG